MSKKIAVLGLGLLGSSMARALAETGIEVIGVDKNIEHVEEVSDVVTVAVQADFTKIDQLIDAGVKEADIGVIASGERLESTILGIMNLERLGINEIIVKTATEDYKEVLLRVGATRVILPEIEMGRHLAYEIIHHDKILSSYQFDEQYRISEVLMEDEWVGKSINEIPFRSDYGFNIIGIKPTAHDKFSISVDPNYVITKESIFLVIHEANEPHNSFFNI
ncbi:potassium channel family protein [Allofustis seminis]|uniref:potassium channel family protein n=1 Tax=Allofustis seminis TaxID=166939 RepID=UPI000376BA20|nr:TrkA family potassium uptake protein [Allofustis seminis]